MNLLFIGPKFYNYHEIIKNGFINAGYEVDYFDDRPSTKYIDKVLLRLNKRFLTNKINKYFNEIKRKVANKYYSVIFVLYGQSFNSNMIRELKEVSPKSKFIFYMYDPICSMPDRLEFSKEFDRRLSFDYNDCEKYGFEFLPLFYSDDNLKNNLKNNFIYDACYIGTMMPGKYILVNKIISQLEEHGFNVFDYQYIQSKSVALFYKLKSDDFKNANFSNFKYKRMTNQECDNIVNDSKIVIDCPKEGQNGMTIRIFEALAANKKIITTNENIKKYDFYKPENIYIFHDAIDFNDLFFKSEYVKIDKEIKEKYSLNHWIKEILKGV